VQKETDVELLGQTRQLGVLFLTNYRLLFVPEKRSHRVQSIPLGCIAQVITLCVSTRSSTASRLNFFVPFFFFLFHSALLTLSSR
jgi:hypothetical protein